MWPSRIAVSRSVKRSVPIFPAIEHIRRHTFFDSVYNFEVDDLHCYAVGQSSILVHNNNGSEGVAGATEGAGGNVAPNSGAAAAAKGLARESQVAQEVGGTVSRQKLIAKGVGSTDLDVLGPAGEYIGVGGPAKAADLSRFGRQLQVLKEVAKQNGTVAQMYLEEGTPETAINLAKKWLGEANVFTFKPQ